MHINCLPWKELCLLTLKNEVWDWLIIKTKETRNVRECSQLHKINFEQLWPKSDHLTNVLNSPCSLNIDSSFFRIFFQQKASYQPLSKPCYHFWCMQSDSFSNTLQELQVKRHANIKQTRLRRKSSCKVKIWSNSKILNKTCCISTHYVHHKPTKK